MDVTVVPTFQTPFTMIVCGPSGSGKTKFVLDILKNQKQLMDTPHRKNVYSYGIENDKLSEFAEYSVVMGGFPEEIDKNSLLILDDMFMMDEKKVAAFFTKSRHCECSTVYIVQSLLFDNKYLRVTFENAHYLALFRYPGDNRTILSLARRMYPQNHKYLVDAFFKATEKPYSYLFLDLKQNTPEALRVKSDIVNNDPIVFVST